MDIRIRKLSYALGAEVTGVEIAQPLTHEAFEAVHRAFLDHCVLLFRGQSFTREQHIAFSRRFGKLDKNETRRYKLAEYPELSTLINKPVREGVPLEAHVGGADWHSDDSFKVNPAIISLLHGVEIPEIGGDTQFYNMYLAYETLSEGMKKLIEPLEGVHMQEERVLDHSCPEALEASRRANTIAHSLVKVHPETGRKSLYIGDKVMFIGGMTPEESRPLIDFLCAHAQRQQFAYRHRWQKGDLLVWDNRCTNHMALVDYDRRHQSRHVEKTSVLGPVSGRLYSEPTHARNLTMSRAA